MEKTCFFLGAVCHSGVTGILAQTVAGAGLSRCPRHTCFLHLEIFSRWHAKTLALCLYRLPHFAWASHSECKCHTSGFYTCTGWWHSACAAVPVLPQFNTHMKVGHLGLPMDMCCRAHASIQEMPHRNGKPAQDFWVPSAMERWINSACMNSLFIFAHCPDALGDGCPALCTDFGLRIIYILILLYEHWFRLWSRF